MSDNELLEELTLAIAESVSDTWAAERVLQIMRDRSLVDGIQGQIINIGTLPGERSFGITIATESLPNWISAALAHEIDVYFVPGEPR